MQYIVNAPIAAIHTGPIYSAITVAAPEIARSAQPGQFVHIQCEGYPLRRPISIAGVDGVSVTFIFEIKGGGTRWLASRKAGDILNLIGPLGHGFPEIPGKVLLAGGGVGVPPMHFCAQRLGQADALLAFRSADRALLTEEIGRLCGSVNLMSDDGSIGTKGFAAQGVEAMLQDGGYAAVFACGPKIMLKTVFEAAQRQGVPCWVSMEERMGCGVGACLTCATPIRGETGEIIMKEACKDGPVFRGEEVVWDD